jgi:hypothetical protein
VIITTCANIFSAAGRNAKVPAETGGSIRSEGEDCQG